MATLGQLGVNGLLAVNSWIGMINSNLQGSSRTAYKPTRPSFLDGTVNQIGTNIFVPSPTLKIQATTLEWAQGSVINSNFTSHFALQGEGFFVLADAAGRFFLSRDGEFHWDGAGYLVNSAGLRVVSSGQDFIRRNKTDASDTFDRNGQSLELKKYGDKSFLIVDVANRDGLRFSPYGATIFELDGDLPLRVQNSLNTTMDGLTFLYRDPKQRTYVDAPEQPPFVTAPVGPATNFTINLGGNGVFDYQAFTTVPFDPAVTTIQQIVTAINNYGIANNLQVSAVYDPGTDRLKITNIPEPKVVDPGFRPGTFAIDFGQNGIFNYYGFDPKTATIQSLIKAINDYATSGGYNIVASYNAVADTFNITNTTAAATNNQITFIGPNDVAMSNFLKMPVSTASTGGGANNVVSALDIDRFPAISPTNPLTDISPLDVANTTFYRMVHPDSSIVFGGPNGQALLQFFRLTDAPQLPKVDPLTGFVGSDLESSRDIDNSDVLTNAILARHDLDILAADVAVKPLLTYLTTTDTTVPAFDFSGPPPVYLHDVANSRVVSDGTANAGHGLIAISQAQTTDAFEIVLDYHTTSNRLELNFGYSRPEQVDSGGFTFFYDPNTGDVNLVLREKDPNKPPTLLASIPAAFPVTTGLGGPAHRLAASLDKDGILSVSVDGSAAQTFSLAGFSQARSGYVSIGHQGNRLEIDNLYADFKGLQNQLATGELVSLSPNPYSTPDVRTGEQDRPRTQILQSALESSTASLTEYVPMLALAQKVFASIAKIVTVATALEDDINSLIR